MKQKKSPFTLGRKVLLLTLAMCALLCAVALAVSYRSYSSQMRDYLERTGENLAGTLASQLTADDLDRYFETLETDDRYYALQDFIVTLVDHSDVEYLYVVRPHGVGVTFLFDSDLRPGSTGDYFAGGNLSLGTYVELEGAFADNLDNLLAGREVEPIVAPDPSFGWLMTIIYPVSHPDGTMAGYIMCDISMQDVVTQQRAFLIRAGGLLGALTLVCMALYLLFIRRVVILPVRQLTGAAQAYSTGADMSAFSKLTFRNRDELRTLADAFRMMLAELKLQSQEQTELAVQEERAEAELKLAAQINAAMLPKELPRSGAGPDFLIRGRVDRQRALSCDFYDYFLKEDGSLCVVLGSVPGGDMSAALFMVAAQAAVKSQLRAALPLTEAVTAVNRQLFEIGRGLALHALVGVLDREGTFTCIDAGQPAPLLFRDQDRYEWLKAPEYAPLGQNENVVYQAQRITLRQGDRLFFHTEGLDSIPGADGQSFGRQELRAALNLSRGRELGLEDLLAYVSDCGRAFAQRPDQVRGCAIAALEYCRRRPSLAHCTVSGDRKGAARMAAFLKEQLGENGFHPREIAGAAVLADELFSLCRRCLPEGERITVECAVSPDRSVTLRLRGPFGHRNPLEAGEGPAFDNAAAFIRSAARQLTFTQHELLDELTAVRPPEEACPAEEA